MNDRILRIYTDGGCSGNQNDKNLGGWGAVLEFGSAMKELYGSERNTTNNRMEMTALLEAIDGFPKRLSLEQQGDFLLGYYHQTNKRFEGKQSTNTQNDQEKQEA